MDLISELRAAELWDAASTSVRRLGRRPAGAEGGWRHPPLFQGCPGEAGGKGQQTRCWLSDAPWGQRPTRRISRGCFQQQLSTKTLPTTMSTTKAQPFWLK